jgi:putative ABC transport system permease protein
MAAGIFIPLLAAFFPILRGARISVREALSNYGASQSAFGETRLESLLARLQMFGTTFLLSARNVFRQRSRLILTLGMLAAGGGMFMGSLNLSRAWDSNVDRIYRERLYDLELQFAAPLQSPMKTADHLQEIPGVTLAEPWQSASMALGRQRKFETTHAYPDGGHGRSVMFAVPPNTRLVRFPLTEGKWLQSDNENEVVLNENARDSDSNLKPGDMVSIFVKGKTTRWKISGFVQDLGTPGATAYVPLAAYQRAVGQNGCCNLIRVAFKDRSPETTQIRTRQVENVLEKDGEVVAYSLQMFELREAISEHTTVLIRSLLALAVLMAAVGGIGLTSTMSMNILERRRELGVMRAIGATPAKVARVIVGEGLMIGILSLVLAFTLSLLLSGFLGNFIGNMAFRTPLPLKVSLMGLAEWIAIVVCGSILATIFPARSAGTITIREALAYE